MTYQAIPAVNIVPIAGALPEAIKYMDSKIARKEKLREFELLLTLDRCSQEHCYCGACRQPQRCSNLYDFIIMNDYVTDMKGGIIAH